MNNFFVLFGMRLLFAEQKVNLFGPVIYEISRGFYKVIALDNDGDKKDVCVGAF